MKLLDKIVRVIIFIGVAICMLLAVKGKDWTQGIFWLLTLFLLWILPPVSFKKDRK